MEDKKDSLTKTISLYKFDADGNIVETQTLYYRDQTRPAYYMLSVDGAHYDLDTSNGALRSTEAQHPPVPAGFLIRHSKEQLLDCIKNLMGIFDSPAARLKIKGDFVEEARQIGRTIIESNK